MSIAPPVVTGRLLPIGKPSLAGRRPRSTERPPDGTVVVDPSGLTGGAGSRRCLHLAPGLGCDRSPVRRVTRQRPAQVAVRRNSMTASTVAASGFLTARSSLGADLTLLVSVAAIVLLTAGVCSLGDGATTHTAGRRPWPCCSTPSWSSSGWCARSCSTSSRGYRAASASTDTPSPPCTPRPSPRAWRLVLFLVVRANQLTRRHESVSRYKRPGRRHLVYLAGFALGVALYVVTYG